MKFDEQALQDVIRRIVEVTDPDRIILFGSAARGEMKPHSDLDLLVIKSGEYDPSELLSEAYVALHGSRYAVDLLMATPEEVERYRHSHCLVVCPAMREGKEVYRAPTAAVR